MHCIAVALALAAPARAGWDEAVAVYEAGDHVTAYRELLPLAEHVHAGAQEILDLIHGKGWGVPLDYGEAVRWFRLAAEQGYHVAQFDLGVMYDQGKGAPQDYAEATRRQQLTAEDGNANAQFNLGVLYDVGRGVPQDYA